MFTWHQEIAIPVSWDFGKCWCKGSASPPPPLKSVWRCLPAGDFLVVRFQACLCPQVEQLLIQVYLLHIGGNGLFTQVGKGPWTPSFGTEEVSLCLKSLHLFTSSPLLPALKESVFHSICRATSTSCLYPAYTVISVSPPLWGALICFFPCNSSLTEHGSSRVLTVVSSPHTCPKGKRLECVTYAQPPISTSSFPFLEPWGLLFTLTQNSLVISCSHLPLSPSVVFVQHLRLWILPWCTAVLILFHLCFCYIEPFWLLSYSLPTFCH